MKSLYFTLTALLLSGASAMAQMNAPMQFAGSATFGGTFFGMTVSQDNASDTVVFKMNGMTDGDITIPALTFTQMGTTIPSFTIHGTAFSFDLSTRNATFTEQAISETITVNGAEKTYAGTLNSASYTSATQTFALSLTFTYGSMPGSITYDFSGLYVTSSTSLDAVETESANTSPCFDLMGRRSEALLPNRLYIRDGKKIVVR